MIQLAVLNSDAAGLSPVARRFPFRIGRSNQADLCLRGDGVWENHAEIQFERGEGFILKTLSGALGLVNGERVETVRLRNGDLLEVGSVKIRFWLAPAVQASLKLREVLTWAALAGLVALQIVLIYALA